MPFSKGDPRINRKGRPKNAEPELLRQALAKEGERRGQDFWDKVASYAFTDRNVMIAVIKKFIPDLTHIDSESEIKIIAMPTAKINQQPQVFEIGNRVTDHIGHPPEASADNNEAQ